MFCMQPKDEAKTNDKKSHNYAILLKTAFEYFLRKEENADKQHFLLLPRFLFFQGHRLSSIYLSPASTCGLIIELFVCLGKEKSWTGYWLSA